MLLPPLHRCLGINDAVRCSGHPTKIVSGVLAYLCRRETCAESGLHSFGSTSAFGEDGWPD